MPSIWITKQMAHLWAEIVLSRELWLLIERKEKYWPVLQAIKQIEQRKPFAGVKRFTMSLTAQAGTDPRGAFPFVQPYLLCGSAFSLNKQTLKPLS